MVAIRWGFTVRETGKSAALTAAPAALLQRQGHIRPYGRGHRTHLSWPPPGPPVPRARTASGLKELVGVLIRRGGHLSFGARWSR